MLTSRLSSSGWFKWCDTTDMLVFKLMCTACPEKQWSKRCQKLCNCYLALTPSLQPSKIEVTTDFLYFASITERKKARGHCKNYAKGTCHRCYYGWYGDGSAYACDKGNKIWLLFVIRCIAEIGERVVYLVVGPYTMHAYIHTYTAFSLQRRQPSYL